ncbi:hypothetical protein [Paenibacillus alkalitolerans]|uniref:hypothetical protein n=1 Tax=Paenibacillus alkalitolerans TaxID=2799335 RepID=UPI0018F3FCAC|nr:hypothetical protein [Paenibacillus alkalitolerans]
MTYPKENLEGFEGQKEEPLPPRRKVHPSNKMQVIRFFYNSLIFLFLILMAGLIIWGNQFLE